MVCCGVLSGVFGMLRGVLKSTVWCVVECCAGAVECCAMALCGLAVSVLTVSV